METADDGKDYIEDANEVFDRVKAGFRWVSDEEQFGFPEDWRIPKDFDRVTGDCDDFAIACRELLREKGYDPRLLTCSIQGVGHLICVLGKIALDNRMRGVVEVKTLVSRHGYSMISISGRKAGDDWHSVVGLK